MSSDAPSQEEVKALLEQSAYEASSVPMLEAFVNAEVAGTAPYFFDANRTLAKLYQFYPDLSNEAMTAKILLLTLLEFPSTDMLSLLYLVPERVQTSEPSASIIRCSELLDSCQFADFWTVYESLPSEFQPAGASERLCQSIANVLALSYRTAPLDVVQPALKPGSNVSKYVEKVDGSVVTFPLSAENTKRNRVFQEGVGFPEIASLMNKASILAKE